MTSPPVPMPAPPHDDLEAAPLGALPMRRIGWWSAGLVVVLLAGATARVLSNTRQAGELASTSATASPRQVLTVRAKAAPGLRDVTLPGTLRGRQEAVVYARTAGYVKRWTKDIGDSVRRGELLAEIDAPEADQELGQARAARDQVRARAALTQSSLARWESLLAKEATSGQEVDERRAAHGQAVADLAAAESNIQRLQVLESLRRVVAPFDGVVVRRQIEVGALVNAGNARELYLLAEIDTLRIDLAVPQTYAAAVQPGQAVQVRWPERPGLVVEGRISRAAPGIDSATRTRQVLIDLPNPDRKLLPGSYVDVQLQGGSGRGGPREGAAANAARDTGKTRERDGLMTAVKDGGTRVGPTTSADAPRLLTVPQGAVQFRQDGPRVVLVKDGRIQLRNVKLGRDLGRELEVREGLSPRDEIVLNPSDSIADGERVTATPAPAPAEKSAATERPRPAPAASAPIEAQGPVAIRRGA